MTSWQFSSSSHAFDNNYNAFRAKIKVCNKNIRIREGISEKGMYSRTPEISAEKSRKILQLINKDERWEYGETHQGIKELQKQVGSTVGEMIALCNATLTGKKTPRIIVQPKIISTGIHSASYYFKIVL